MKEQLHKVACFLCLFIGIAHAQAQFITTWKTDNIGTSDDNQITIPTQGIGYDYTVEWGDGSTSLNVTGDTTHTYATAGTYTVSISGDFPRIYFNDQGDKDKIVNIDQWGDISWTTMERAFFGCKNFTSDAVDAPDLSNVGSLSKMFERASSFNGAIDHWDVSNSTNMVSMFNGASSFNQPLNSWNVSNVTLMIGLFSGASVFNQDLSSWNVSKVVNMTSMFSASAFNQDISAWDVSNVTSMSSMFSNTSAFNQNIENWNVGKVTNFFGMFSRANSFNQDLNNWNMESAQSIQVMFGLNTAFNGDVSDWNVSNVINFGTVFKGATAFNQDITGWDLSKAERIDGMFDGATSFNQNIGNWNVSNVTNMIQAFDNSGISRMNYDSILIGWSQQTLQSDVTLEANGLEYCNGATARQSIIDNFGWTITDAGENCFLNIPDANFKAELLADATINTLDDGEISFLEAAAFTGGINVSGKNIVDLTGIEAFENMTELDCRENNLLTTVDVTNNQALTSLNFFRCSLNSIDVTQNIHLITLSVVQNELSSLDVTQNIALENLLVSQNNLTSIDVTNNIALEQVGLNGNELTSLDVTKNTALTGLAVVDNPLTDLDVSNNVLLNIFGCGFCELTSLDLSSNINLTEFYCQDNNLTQLNIANGNNANVSNPRFIVTGNPNLTCIEVDDSTFSADNWTNIDSQSFFSEDCGIINGIDTEFYSTISIYPNPINEFVHLEESVSWTLSNAQGQVLQTGKKETINLSSYEQGMYFLTLQDGRIAKLIKE